MTKTTLKTGLDHTMEIYMIGDPIVKNSIMVTGAIISWDHGVLLLSGVLILWSAWDLFVKLRAGFALFKVNRKKAKKAAKKAEKAAAKELILVEA